MKNLKEHIEANGFKIILEFEPDKLCMAVPQAGFSGNPELFESQELTPAQEQWCQDLESGEFQQTRGTLVEFLEPLNSDILALKHQYTTQAELEEKLPELCGFCCLGVGAHRLHQSTVKSPSAIYWKLISEGVLNYTATMELGLHSASGDFPLIKNSADLGYVTIIRELEDQEFHKVTRCNSLVGLNDSALLDFKQIATFIRKYPRLVFKTFQ